MVSVLTMSVLIGVQTVCKGYQQTTKVATSNERVKDMSQHMRFWCIRFGPRREKTCLGGFATNKGADHPAYLRRLFSAFVISILESIISKLATGEISVFRLVIVAKETGLNLTLLETLMTGFLALRHI